MSDIRVDIKRFSAISNAWVFPARGDLLSVFPSDMQAAMLEALATGKADRYGFVPFVSCGQELFVRERSQDAHQDALEACAE